jgi:PAS domain S-box-containing protein
LVDDDPAILDIYSLLLRAQGYQVWQAETGRGGLQLAREQHPDLVLLDVMLPDANGIDICREIKGDSALQDLFVVLCSGAAISPAERVDGFNAGADEYLLKPLDVNEFLARIRTVVRLQETTTALRASEKHYRELIDILPDAVFQATSAGRLITVNQQAVKLMGRGESPLKILESSIFDYIAPEHHDRAKADLIATLQQGILRDRDYQLVGRAGNSFSAEVTTTVLKDSKGHLAGLVGVVRDITDRKKAEQRLADALELNETMMAASSTGILAYRASGECVFANEASARIVAGSPSKLCQQNFRKLPSWKACGLLDLAERTLQTGSIQMGEVHGRSSFGKKMWLDCQMAPFVSHSEPHLLCLITDITERKRAEEGLHESQRRQQAILDHIPAPAWLRDEKGRLLDCNEAFAKSYGWTREEVIDKTIFDLAPGVAEQRAREDEEVIRTLRPACYEHHVVKQDGRSQWFETSKSPVLDGRGKVLGTVGISHDVTERKRIEEELRTTQRRIIQAQEAERWRVAGELHDGVNQIIASAKLRLRKVVESSIATISPAAREVLARCDRLLVQALEENRRIARNLRPMDLDELGFAEATHSLCKEIQSRTSLLIDCRISGLDRRLPPAAELGLFRIVQEALSNVEKHSGAKNVSVHIALVEGSLVLQIQDDGRGFGSAPTKPSRSTRSGLGLTSMRERAEVLGAHCEIKSVPKHGTAITVKFPHVAGKAKTQNESL